MSKIIFRKKSLKDKEMFVSICLILRFGIYWCLPTCKETNQNFRPTNWLFYAHSHTHTHALTRAPTHKNYPAGRRVNAPTSHQFGPRSIPGVSTFFLTLKTHLVDASSTTSVVHNLLFYTLDNRSSRNQTLTNLIYLTTSSHWQASYIVNGLDRTGLTKLLSLISMFLLCCWFSIILCIPHSSYVSRG